MPDVRKNLQTHHISQSRVGKIINFAATPYEGVSFPLNALSGESSWEGYSISGGGFNAGLGDVRPDVKLISAKGSGMGWTFTHEARGRSAGYGVFRGNRALATYVYELANVFDSFWYCPSGGYVAGSIVLPDGVSSRVGRNGLDVLTIQSATPDYFLGNIELPSMNYLLAEPANKERKKWYDLCTYGYDTTKPAPDPLPTSPELKRASAQNQLGQTFKGAGAGGIADGVYQDPLGGFGFYTDDYTMTVGQAMQPRPCNEYHLMKKLSSSRILVEILSNHVKVNGLPISQTFGLDINTDLDIENNILTGDVSGTINSIIGEMSQHGVWRAWWDSLSNFHFIPDYYAALAGGVLLITEGPSLIGELEINLGTDQKRVNRAEVKGQPFISFGDATTDPLTSNINMALGAVYPPGTPKGGDGSDVTMDNYMGRNTGEQARRMYNKANAKTTFKWSNFPYPTLAFGLLNKPVAIIAHDPKGNWTLGGKAFVVTDVEIQLNDGDRPDGGYYLCSVAGIEI